MEMHGVCNASSLTATDSEKAAAQHGRLDTGTPSVVQKRRDFADSGGVEIAIEFGFNCVGDFRPVK
jgi:hypothetical protein